MKTFEDIKKEKEQLDLEYSARSRQLEASALKLIEIKFDSNSQLKNKLKAYIDQLESTTDLSNIPYDEYVHRWIRFDASEFIDTSMPLQVSAFTEYLQENYFAYLDFKDGILSMSEGPCILINDYGDVLDQDSGQWFLSKNSYGEDLAERNRLIEKYMETRGYFPSVVYCDHYGNISYVDTKKEQ